MPKPVYIICSESALEDRETGHVSIISVIDKLEYHLGDLSPSDIESGAASIANFPSRLTATWMKEDSDDGVEFEHEVAFSMPNTGSELVVLNHTFVFESFPCMRFNIKIPRFPGVRAPGIMYLTSRIRKKNATEWISQSYPIVVEFAKTPE